MPDETRQPDSLEARAKEIAREYFAYLRGQQTYPPMIALERMALAALRTVQQETARETWERAAQIAEASQLVGRPRNRGEDCWNQAARLIARTLRDQLPVLQPHAVGRHAARESGPFTSRVPDHVSAPEDR